MDTTQRTPKYQAPPASRPPAHYRILGIGLLFGFCCMVVVFFFMQTNNTPPELFPVGVDITIAEGLSVTEIVDQLHEAHVVRSPLHLTVTLRMYHDSDFIQAGSYRFTQPQTAREVATHITAGTSMTPPHQVTFPEGFRIADLESYLPPHLTKDSNLSSLEVLEGYLFPDTYFITEDETLAAILRRMQQTFDEKITPYLPDIAAQQLTIADVVTLASILEREANDETSMKLVAGILFNRLTIGMPLQVDATFEYERGKGSSELTYADLETDSPYNTYTRTGLPPTPIANPGTTAIDAVLNPTPSAYFYYLTAPDGTFHYAKTFEEHRRNKAQYLR